MRLIFFDTETTGLRACDERIVEIAAIELDETFQPKGFFHEYLDPGKPVGPTEMIHGLSDGFLRGRPAFSDIAASFVDFVSGAELWAHNMPFDRSFVTAELARCGFPALTSFAQTKDTMPLSRRLFPAGGHSLDVLARHYGIDLSGRAEYHGALVDAEILTRVWLCMKGRAEAAARLDLSEIIQLDSLHQQARENERRLRLSASSTEGLRPIDEAREYMKKLNAIAEWAEDNTWFDCEMYYSMIRQLEGRGFLTERQKAVIDRIMERFNIE